MIRGDRIFNFIKLVIEQYNGDTLDPKHKAELKKLSQNGIDALSEFGEILGEAIASGIKKASHFR